MWYVATSASVTNGSSVVTINTGDDISTVQERSGLVFEDGSPVEVVKAYLDGTGKKIIQLARPWVYTTRTNQSLVIYPTDADFSAATAELRRVIGTLQVASIVEAQAGTDDEKIMTPLKTKQAISAQTGTAATKDVTTSSTDTTIGRLLKVGDFGLGGKVALLGSDVDLNLLNFATGVYGVTSPVQNSPIASAAGDIVDVKVYNSNGIVQTYYRRFLGLTHGRFWYRSYSGAGWSGWGEVYHSGNTNFNEFGGVSAGNSIAQGYARGYKSARVYLPIASTSNPTSVSFSGTFTIRVNNAVIETGLIPTSSTVSVLSSNRYAIIEFATTESMEVGGFIDVISDGSESKFTVNF